MALPKLKSALSAAAGAALVMTPIASANGQEARATQVSATTAPPCGQVQGYVENHCATPGFEQPMSLSEIRQEPSIYRDRVILHFGPQIMDADLAAYSLSISGTPAIAVPGGPDCGVQIVIDGRTSEQLCFSQRGLDSGEVGGLAERTFAAYVRQRENAQVAMVDGRPVNLP